jgi:hypothetical protein
MTSVERTAYPQFPRLVTARELHVFYTPSADESSWTRERTGTGEHLLALTLALKCFQRMGRFSPA